MQTISENRRYDLDWLRVFAVLMLIPVHAARPFVAPVWSLSNGEFSKGMELLLGIIEPWHMSILFLISGSATWFALRSRSKESYIYTRITRLFVPLLAAVFLITIPQSYLHNSFNGAYEGSFFAYIPYALSQPGILQLGESHLWFIQYLFYYSVIFLPLFLWLRETEKGQSILKMITTKARLTGFVFLGALPLMLIEGLLRPSFPTSLRGDFFADWSNVIFWGVCYVYGFVLVSDPTISLKISRYRHMALVAGITSTVGYFAAFVYINNNPSLPINLAWVLHGFAAWTMMLALMGYAYRHFQYKNRTLTYLNESVLPFYILHRLVLAAIAVVILPLTQPIVLEFVVIGLGTLALTYAVYEWGVRPNNTLRFLFGMPLADKRATSVILESKRTITTLSEDTFASPAKLVQEASQPVTAIIGETVQTAAIVAGDTVETAAALSEEELQSILFATDETLLNEDEIVSDLNITADTDDITVASQPIGSEDSVETAPALSTDELKSILEEPDDITVARQPVSSDDHVETAPALSSDELKSILEEPDDTVASKAIISESGGDNTPEDKSDSSDVDAVAGD